MTQFKTGQTEPNFQFSTEVLFSIPLIADEREFKERKIDDVLAWLAANDPNSRIKNFEMIDAYSEVKYFQERGHELEQERDWMIHQRLFQHQREITQIEETTLLDNFVGPAHQAEVERKKLVQEKIAQQEQMCDQDVKLIAGRYQTLMKQCEERLQLSQTNQDNAYRSWQDENEGTEVKQVG